MLDLGIYIYNVLDNCQCSEIEDNITLLATDNWAYNHNVLIRQTLIRIYGFLWDPKRRFNDETYFFHLVLSFLEIICHPKHLLLFRNWGEMEIDVDEGKLIK